MDENTPDPKQPGWSLRRCFPAEGPHGGAIREQRARIADMLDGGARRRRQLLATLVEVGEGLASLAEWEMQIESERVTLALLVADAERQGGG